MSLLPVIAGPADLVTQEGSKGPVNRVFLPIALLQYFLKLLPETGMPGMRNQI